MSVEEDKIVDQMLKDALEKAKKEKSKIIQKMLKN